MGDVGGVLLDDRALVQVGGGIVGGGADELHAAVVGLPIRVGADEGRQERVVDVDDPTRVSGDETVAEDLHVASHHDQFDAVVGERCEHLGLLLGLGVGRDREVQVWHPHVLGDTGVVRVVRHDDAQVHREFATAPAGEQVVETMRVFRRHERRWRGGVGETEVDRHTEKSGDRCEGVDDLFTVEAEPVEVELDTLEKDGVAAAGARIDVLLGVHDVAVMIGQELRSGSDDAGLVGARKQQYSGHGHGSTGDFRAGGGRARSRPQPWPPRH